MFEDCNFDKFEFINKVKEYAEETKHRVQARLQYEDKLKRITEEKGSLEEERLAWEEYIDYEISQDRLKRAKLLYESGLISLDRDRFFFLNYLQFLEKHMQDFAMVRAKFEQRVKHCDKNEVVDIMVENALFEEEQQQI